MERPQQADLAQFHKGGPIDTCLTFLDAVFAHGSYDDAWALMDDNLRRCRTQVFVWRICDTYPAERGRENELVEELLEGPGAGTGWRKFVDHEIEQLERSWGVLYARQLSGASKPGRSAWT